ncbi:lysozyme inhibitor LprI family protein [Zestomonas carbonaria]|uniref:lysozyme inhibitor LprI family protein n=1 Tax=Zestomonas carbonaria TaxID=2762745 RepID=UPI0016571AEC
MNSVTINLKSIAFISLLTMSGLSYATQDCEKPNNSQQVFECSKVASTIANHVLNKAYKDLISRIREQYLPAPKLGDEYIEKIKKSQRTWITLRDSDCEIEVFIIEPGTQAYETTKNHCAARLTDARRSFLDSTSQH